MNAPRYIELTSAHRNRHNWPCPADFIVPVSCINRGSTPLEARDKVVSGYPEHAWFQYPYASPQVQDGPVTPRMINGKFYTSLFPLARNPDGLDNSIRGQVTALKFGGGTSSSPVLNPLMVSPPNVWKATYPPESNSILNPYYCPINDYFTGALLIRFTSDPSAALNSAPYSWNGSCESSVIIGYQSATATVFLQTSFSDSFSENDFFLIDFNTDPSNQWSEFVPGGARIFVPGGSEGKNAYAGLYLQNYTWTKNGLDNDDESGFTRIQRYDASRRLAYLASALPLVEQLVCSETGNPDTFFGSNTFTIRNQVPTICRTLHRLGVSNGSVSDITILNAGSGYRLGEIIASADGDWFFNRYYASPGNSIEYPEPDYVLIGGGTALVCAIAGTTEVGGVAALKVLQQGSGFSINCPYPIEVLAGSKPATVPGHHRRKGQGSGGIIAFPQVYQSLEIHSRWGGDSMTTVRSGDFLFLPTIGQIDNNGYCNYSNETTPPAMPRYAYMPATTDQECPSTRFNHLDIRFSGYPARIDCKPENGQHVFPFSGTVQIGHVMRKNETFNDMWSTKAGYPEEDALGPITVLLLEGGFNIAEAGLTDWGQPAYLPSSTVKGSGVLHDQDLEVLSFLEDNEHALNYTGSTVSQNQMVCYAINLTSLTLPNIPLRNEIGGLIAFYPYIYVELSNVTAPSSGNRGILYSNNPHANRALFRVTVDDINTPLRSKFVKLDGDGAVQVVKFKPNDNLHFRVFLQNGLLFQTERQDFAPPLHPDFFVQIGACFGIKRLL